ncbi:MAG: AAA family ATPase, partial [Candidatus Eisenbacteria bacterium]|nr:AAA family ATPase [Candidatus Eisenbacteria bacterium]
MTRPLPPGAAQEPVWTPAQQLAVETIDRDLLVSAGAGTGKTTVLIEHALQLLRAGVPLRELLLITFTRKAADQLRERLFRELSRSGDPKLRALIPLVPRAHISTIHGFCQRLLREASADAGVDPGFRILDPTAADLLLNETMRAVLDGWYDAGDGETRDLFGRLVEICQGQPDGLQGVLRSTIGIVRATEDPERTLARIARRTSMPYRTEYRRLVNQSMAGLRRAAEDLQHALAALDRLTPAARELHDACARLQDSARPVGATRDLWRRRSALIETGLIDDTGGWKVSLPRPRLSGDARTAKARLKKHLENLALRELPPTKEDLLRQERHIAVFGRLVSRLLHELIDAYNAAKEERGQLDFADLEILTARFLESELLAGKDPARRFAHVLVDEYQDINRLQGRIIDLLTSGRRRFLVGDLKQCIYEFRQSAPEIFSEMLRDHLAIEDPQAIIAGTSPRPEAPCWAIRIGESFRSRAAILDTVNFVFRELFREETLGVAYAGQELIPGIRQETRGGEPVPDAPAELHVVTPGSKERDAPRQKEPPADAPRPRSEAEREALLTARRLRRLVKEESPEVWDDTEKRRRRVRWGDIAVLMRSPGTGWGRTFLRVLRQEGIPAHLGRGGGFFEAEEVADALNLFRVLDNTLNDIPLASLLRSPVFGWRDDDLALLRLAYPEADYLWPAMEALAGAAATAQDTADTLRGRTHDLPPEHLARVTERSRTAVETISAWRGRLGQREIATVLAGILHDSQLLPLMEARSQGALRGANLRKLMDLVDTYSREHGHSLPGLLSWLDAVQVESGDVPSVPGAAEAGDTVRILSVHMAKGLEFPVVCVAQLGRRLQIGGRPAPLVLTPDGLAVDILEPRTFIRRRTVAHWTWRTVLGHRDAFEEMRILYVAMTRARERLILVGSLRHGKYLT